MKVAGLFKYRGLSVILFAVVLSTTFLNYETWGQSNDSAKALAREPEARSQSKSKSEVLALKEEPKSVQSIRIIAEKNIFSPERKDFPGPAATPKEQPKLPARPNVILSGVAISENYQAATVSSPGRPLRKGEREAMTLKLGDKIGDYSLAKIADDRITLEAAGDSFEVLLYDPKKPKARIEVRTAEVNAPGARSIRPAPANDIAMYQAMRKRAEQAQAMVIAAALPSLEENPLYYSRQARSKRHAELNRHMVN